MAVRAEVILWPVLAMESEGSERIEECADEVVSMDFESYDEHSVKDVTACKCFLYGAVRHGRKIWRHDVYWVALMMSLIGWHDEFSSLPSKESFVLKLMPRLMFDVMLVVMTAEEDSRTSLNPCVPFLYFERLTLVEFHSLK